MPVIKPLPLLNKIIDLMRVHLPKNLPHKCIIIGSADSLLSGHYGEYIDNEKDAYVVRINRPPLEKWKEHYGSKTDLMICWKYPKTVYPFKVCRLKLNAYLGQIRMAFNKEILYPTTGFGSLCILAAIFEEIELFGYGWNKRIYEDRGIHYMDGTVHIRAHDLTLEDKWINQMQLDNPGKIYRGEEIHLDLRYPDFDPSPKN